MLIIEVQTPAFSGRFLHDTELSRAHIYQARLDSTPGLGELLGFLKLSLVDQNQLTAFEDLKVSEALEVWKVFRATKPTRWEIPNEVPAWL